MTYFDPLWAPPPRKPPRQEREPDMTPGLIDERERRLIERAKAQIRQASFEHDRPTYERLAQAAADDSNWKVRE